MRPGVTASMEFLSSRGGESIGASLLRGVICFEALGVGVGREVVLVDAWRAQEELIIQLKVVNDTWLNIPRVGSRESGTSGYQGQLD